MTHKKTVVLGFRSSVELIAQIDKEVQREEAARPGLPISRTNMIKMLLTEALAARAKREGGRR